MRKDGLTIGGEFFDPAREAQYRAERMPEDRRNVRLVFAAAFVINVLFYLNDWHSFGQPHFAAAIAARTVIVVMSLLCLAAATRRATNFAGLQRLSAIWTAPVAIACAALVLPHTESALFITFVLPNIFFLTLPMSFRWAVTAGLAASYLVLFTYILSGPLTEASFGLALGMLTLDVVLILLVRQSNRLRRLQWSATQALRLANRDLSNHRAALQNLIEAMPTPLLVIAYNDGSLIQANAAARRYFGEAALADQAALRRCFQPKTLDTVRSLLRTKGRADGIETRLRVAGDVPRDALLAAVPVAMEGRDAIMAILVDITDRKKMEANLERLATTDPLTGLANRTRFFTLAHAEIGRSQRYGSPLAVAMIDIDFFKRINDTCGHEGGDLFLLAFAELCRTVVRDQDIPARLGGEEFALLLPETTPQHAEILAERLRRAAEAMRVPSFPDTVMTVSIGLSAVQAGETTVDLALSRADKALYAVKHAGRNRVLPFETLETAAPSA